jgi:hypothetical protein
MVSKISIANIVGWAVISGGIFLTSYHGCRSQFVIYERDGFGNINSAKLHQLGRNQKLILDSHNPNQLVVEGNPTLDYICDSIGSNTQKLYDYCQSLRKQIYSEDFQQEDSKK